MNIDEYAHGILNQIDNVFEDNDNDCHSYNSKSETNLIIEVNNENNDDYDLDFNNENILLNDNKKLVEEDFQFIEEGNFDEGNKQENLLHKNYIVADFAFWTKDFHWDKLVSLAKKVIFQISKFRTNQKEIINAILSRKDVFVNMPTGGGKSLLFQLPAAISINVTIVIMPLLSLINDQINYLNKLGIPAIHLKDDFCYDKNFLYNNFDKKNGENIKLIYLTPEKLFLNDHSKTLIKILYSKGCIDRFVIDEVHCISQWGKDFRPEYLNLKNLKEEYPTIPILTMTATASNEVREETINLLKLKDCILFRTSYNRSNLYFEIRDKTLYSNPLKNLAQFIKSSYPNSSGIIYCASRKACESISQKLKIDYGFSAEYFHSLLSDLKKKDIQEKFMNEKIKVLVATIAFGMGINKTNIRYVVHFTLPKSFENYYQEIGRAGRDGIKSHVILYFNPNERKTLDFLLAKSGGDNHTKTQNLRKINQVINFCEEKFQCRRTIALKYFGENFNKEKCLKMCDNCKNNIPFEIQNVTKDAYEIICFYLFLKNSTFKMTINQSASYLKGIKLDKFKTFGFLLKSEKKYFGLLKDWEVYDISRLIRVLIIKSYLCENVEIFYENVICYVELDSLSYDVIHNPSIDFNIEISFPLNLRKVKSKINDGENISNNSKLEINSRYFGITNTPLHSKKNSNIFNLIKTESSNIFNHNEEILYSSMLEDKNINTPLDVNQLKRTLFDENNNYNCVLLTEKENNQEIKELLNNKRHYNEKEREIIFDRKRIKKTFI